jgi:RNA polymerase sigma factor (TIGR02999 family)
MQHDADITQLLIAASEGDVHAMDRVVPLVYQQLKRMARSRLRNERPDHTLDTTALVHEAYLRLLDVNQIEWQGRSHFLSMSARIMRRVLVDYAQRRNALKRGGGQRNLQLEEEVHLIPEAHAEIMADLDEALTRLEAVSPRCSQVIEHRYFGGLTLEETATVLGVSLATVKRDARFAQAWLANELGPEFGL